MSLSQTLPVVAIVGRPNVGKSALFNRFVQRRQALVDATPGSTRDRLYGEVEWRGLPFQIVDTGGLQVGSGPRDRLSQRIAAQVTKAVQEADLTLMLCDVRQGVVPLDREVASWIRKRGRPNLLVVNKVDTDRELPGIYEFCVLGVGDPYPVSALHGRRVGELLDAIVEQLERVERVPGLRPGAPGEELSGAVSPLKVAVVGRPNVGKSSIVNRILNEERVLVDEAPGTTRDPVPVPFTYEGRQFSLIDTAGMRARRRLSTRIDAVARLKALEVIQQADVCLGVLEGPVGIVQEDLKLLDLVLKTGKPLCLAVNKWDLVPAGVDPRQVALKIAHRAPFLRFAPVLCTSAKSGLNVLKALELASQVADRARGRITPAEGRQLLLKIQKDPKAPVGIRNARLFRLTQPATAPPTFHLLGRIKRELRSSDLGYLERVLREELRLEGTPIRIRILTLKGRAAESWRQR